MVELSSTDMGSGSIDQHSINEYIHLKEVIDIFYGNISLIKKLINKKDIYAKELFTFIERNKNLNFPINKPSELYIIKNKNNLEKVTNYLIFRYKFYISGKKKINLGYPPYLLIEPVSTCNLRCPFCFQTDKSFTRKPFMGVIDYDFFKKIVDQANDLGCGAITLASRGEPTMHKQFSDMLSYINNKKNIFELKTNTNGTFLNEEICHQIFKNNVTQVVISSDHYIKEDYERLRVGSKFEKVVKNVDMLFDIRKKYYKKSLTEIRVSGIDNEGTLDRTKFRDFWIKRSDHVTAGYPLERWNTYLNIPHPDIDDPCRQLWDRMYIWFDGKVNPCDADYKSKLSFGNAKETSIKELWNNDAISQTRARHLLNRRNEVTPCDRCGVTYK